MIRMRQHLINQLRSLSEKEYPYECCGLLLGRFEDEGRKSLVELFPIANAREQEARKRRFLIEPAQLMKGERYAREKQLDVIGFYHSHPQDSGIPSDYDLDNAWPVYSYVIVSVHDGKAKDLFSWQMQEDRARFRAEEVVKEN